ncbi:MAG TPA: fumarylacetoacetate hydrolase family protein [Casimicrobiaceae bacterium]|jgi:fumarylacetoacetate (FAA) hydrolase family protein|nr:fumarylacetoacetate hydrolase family protein [Casimicrobiaceae bacterium]
MTLDLRPFLTSSRCLPTDAARALLIGRAWVPAVDGPVLVCVDGDDLLDLSAIAPTCSELLNRADVVHEIRAANALPRVGALSDALANAADAARDPAKPWLLAPCDLQPVKASGVTFVASMLERVIEEQARGDPARADEVRRKVAAAIGDNLRNVVPGSAEAVRVKQVLQGEGLWSQYLEVGIGPDAEIFTKAPPMASVGTGAAIGIHRKSTWNNPEPEVVLAVSARAQTVGAALGNDVNLRDFEGRSALLLGRAKDNNASCAIGPFIRLFDERFTLDHVRASTLELTVEGDDGFVLRGACPLAEISRDPLDLVAHAIGPDHQYPDGLMLFLGTMFAPIEDRREPGQGFTHDVGDVVTIAAPALGALVNRVDYCDAIAPWTFGVGALMRNLAQRRAYGEGRPPRL